MNHSLDFHHHSLITLVKVWITLVKDVDFWDKSHSNATSQFLGDCSREEFCPERPSTQKICF